MTWCYDAALTVLSVLPIIVIGVIVAMVAFSLGGEDQW